MENQRFSINGIKVTAKHLGGGLYVGIPDDLGEALKALLSGKLFEPRDIQLLPREEAKPQARPMPYTPAPAAVPAPKPQAKRETITAYRQRTGTSRTAMADILNISRRSLGRWEMKGKHMDEV